MIPTLPDDYFLHLRFEMEFVTRSKDDLDVREYENFTRKKKTRNGHGVAKLLNLSAGLLTFDFWSSFMILSRRFSVNRALPHRKLEQTAKEISLPRSILVIVAVRLARVPQDTLSCSTPLTSMNLVMLPLSREHS